ncbi:MAG: CapA family protein [Thomasclavelia sp.]|uniref:CapA family protein n=1 Tax=Thomasclavelia sp. TaxID=3025757 RepID=UPI0039A19223
MKKTILKKSFKINCALLLLLFSTLGLFYFLNKEPTTTKSANKTFNKQTEKIVNASFIGDLLYEQPYYDWIGPSYNDKGYYDLVKPYFLNDDLTLANMEVPIGGSELKVSGTGYSFNAPNEIGKHVINMGVDAVNLANNHANDAGIKGRINTLNFFKQHNILTTGVYESKDARQQIPTKSINNITFSFLGYTYKTNKPDYQNQDLIGYYRNLDTMTLDNEHKQIIKDEVEHAKQLSDVVIVSVHWGNEFTYTVNNEQKELANYLNELGVNVIIGHHSHCIQPIEWIENKNYKTLVVYSLGSFISADNEVTRASQEFANAYNISMILQMNFVKTNNTVSIKNINSIPIINYYDQNLNNFKLVPLDQYTQNLETTHNRYSKGLTKDFVINSFNNVIDQQFIVN